MTRFDFRSERGFSMVVVMVVMAVATMFVAARSRPPTATCRSPTRRPTASRPTRRPRPGSTSTSTTSTRTTDYWTKCTDVPRRTRPRTSPVNQAWNGTGTDPRTLAQGRRARRRSTRSSCCRPTAAPTCVENNEATMIDPATGTFKIRVDRPVRRERQAQAQHRRDVPPRALPRLPLLHRLRDDRPESTLLEQRPGVGAGQLRRPKYRAAARRATAARRSSSPTADAINGPVPHQRRHPHLRHAARSAATARTRSRSTGPRTGLTRRSAARLPGGDPDVQRARKRRRRQGARRCRPPTRRCRRSRPPAASSTPARRSIRFNSDGDDGRSTNADTGGTHTRTSALPANGVIYVDEQRLGCCGTTQPPLDAELRRARRLRQPLRSAAPTRAAHARQRPTTSSSRRRSIPLARQSDPVERRPGDAGDVGARPDRRQLRARLARPSIACADRVQPQGVRRQ